MVLCDWHLLFSIMFSSFIHVSMNQYLIPFLEILFSWPSDMPLYRYTIFLICLSEEGYLGYFHILPVMNNGGLNVCVQVAVWTYIFF